MRRSWHVLPVLLAACKVTDPGPVTAAFTDQFERHELGDLYLASGEGYRVAAGALSAHGAHNHPLWLRKQIPEPVFGIIKSVMGFRQFMLRGIDKVRGEWRLVTMTWNMKRMFVLCPRG